MKRLRLLSWFRRRMLPLVVIASLLLAASAPIAYYLTRRREILHAARQSASQVAGVLLGEIEERPLLWRYASVKLSARLAEEGLARLECLTVQDAQGVRLPLSVPCPQRGRPVLFGQAQLTHEGRHLGTVWVASDLAPLYADTGKLALVFLLLGIGLGTVLYLMPMRAITSAEHRIGMLLGQLALTLQEEDRRRIARDLHDGAGQALTAARLKLLAVQKRLGPALHATLNARDQHEAAAGAPQEEDALLQIAAHLDRAMEEIRCSVSALLPPDLTQHGLRGALLRHCEAFSAATGLGVHCEISELALPAHVETTCYRIVQEALTNSARHSDARQANVRIAPSPGGLLIEISDDGGAAAEPLVPGHGLLGIRERAELLGGSATFVLRKGQGMAVKVELPVGSA